MIGKDELELSKRVRGLVQDIERVRRETAVKIEALEKEREGCLARIEPSAEVLVAKKRIEEMLGAIVLERGVVKANLQGQEVERGAGPPPMIDVVEPRVVDEGSSDGGDDWLSGPPVAVEEARPLADDDWLSESVARPVESMPARPQTPSMASGDDDWLSGLSDEGDTADAESDDFW